MESSRLSRPLLATKLHVPHPRPRFLPRPRLLEQLAAGTARELTLACAPAANRTQAVTRARRLGLLP